MTIGCPPDFIDPRVIRLLHDRHQKRLDPSYLRFLSENHQGELRFVYFTDAAGSVRQISRFLPLIDNHSELQPPLQQSMAWPARDVRIDWGVLTFIEEQGPLAEGLFGGERLIPLAALCTDTRHPDELQLQGGDLNLVAFDYAPGSDRPAVVVWLARQAQREVDRWADLKSAGDWQDTIRYDDFTLPVATDFDEFEARLSNSRENAYVSSGSPRRW